MTARNAAAPNWFLRLAIFAVVVGLIYFGVSYYLRQEAVVVPAKLGVALRTVPGTVTAKAEFDVELKSEVGGRVKTTELEVGRKFFKGDTLVTIDSGDVDLEIERIKNEIVAAKRRKEIGSTLTADEKNKLDALDILERQVKAGASSPIELEREKRLYQQLVQRRELDEVALRLSLETLENQLRAREREKSKMTITAPADGVVTSVIARVGDLIGSNSPIATMISVGRTIEAKISEENFAAVRIGQRATVRFLTFGDDSYEAKISKILPSADPATQRYTVFLDVAVPEGRVLLPGLTGEVVIIIEERANAVLIPRRALVGDYVYVLEGSKVALRKVEKGFEGFTEVEIVAGLKEGEQVVVEQQDLYRDGDRVRVRVLETKSK
jgi:RND family efflux transporter MFP subunit